VGIRKKDSLLVEHCFRIFLLHLKFSTLSLILQCETTTFRKDCQMVVKFRFSIGEGLVDSSVIFYDMNCNF